MDSSRALAGHPRGVRRALRTRSVNHRPARVAYRTVTGLNDSSDGKGAIFRLLATSVVDRLVGQGPEIETDIGRTGGSPGALGHQDGDHLLRGVQDSRG